MGRALAREPPAALPPLPDGGRGGCLRGGHVGRRFEAAQLDPERLSLRDERRHALALHLPRLARPGLEQARLRDGAQRGPRPEQTLARIRDRGLYVSRLTFGQFFPDWLRARDPT
jgi:hypothetical protein